MKAKLLSALLVSTTLLVASVRAAEVGTAKGGATRFLRDSKVASPVAVAAITEEAKSCAKCQDKQITRVERPTKGVQVRLVSFTQHECGSCVTKSATVGHGKGMKEVALHTCGESAEIGKPCCSK